MSATTTSKPTTPRRGLSPELAALAKIERILATCDQKAARRILEWLLDKNAEHDADANHAAGA